MLKHTTSNTKAYKQETSYAQAQKQETSKQTKLNRKMIGLTLDIQSVVFKELLLKLNQITNDLFLDLVNVLGGNNLNFIPCLES